MEKRKPNDTATDKRYQRRNDDGTFGETRPPSHKRGARQHQDAEVLTQAGDRKRGGGSHVRVYDQKPVTKKGSVTSTQANKAVLKYILGIKK